MTSRPAAILAWILGIALVIACPAVVPAALTVICWALTQPVVLGVGLAATLVWCATHPARRVLVGAVR
ncbi:hypothetical protein ACIQVR_40965 [Streptomyces xanthochromogenes]|uniref:hypothetical protein n=1 Tax=Streptomyces xanthochromogenes TaxID=67384 RepID=UPI0038009DD6